MFTGIVEELGTLQSIAAQGNTLVLAIQANKILEDLKLGDSVSVNGVCLTVTKIMARSFLVDVMPETFKDTSLALLKHGSKVNLERALSANGRFGGHFVTGHVDTVGKIMKMDKKENAIYIDISVTKEYAYLLLLKGSIAIDGTSLTIFACETGRVTVSIIPHTAKESLLGYKKVGDLVNLEFDLIGKYLHHFYTTRSQEKMGISKDFLQENGFLSPLNGQ